MYLEKRAKVIFVLVVLIFTFSAFAESRRDAYKAVKQNGLALEFVDDNYKKDKMVVIKALKQNIEAYKYVDPSLWADKEFVLIVARSKMEAFKYVDNVLKRDREFILKAIRPDKLINYWNPAVLKYVDESLRNDRDFILKVIKDNSSMLHSGNELLGFLDAAVYRKDKQFLLKLVLINSNFFVYADNSLKKDKKFVLDVMKKNGLALEYADDILKKDREVVIAAVNQVATALDYADDALTKDQDITFIITQKEKSEILTSLDRVSPGGGLFLKYINDDLKSDREIMLKAVKNDGALLRYASINLKKDKEVVLVAVKEKSQYYDKKADAFLLADLSLRSNKEIVKATMLTGFSIIDGYEYYDDKGTEFNKLVDNLLSLDKLLVQKTLLEKKEPYFLAQFINEKFRDDINFIKDLIKLDGNVIEFASIDLKSNKNLVLFALKNGASLCSASAKLITDREVVDFALKENPNNLGCTSSSLRNDKNFILEIIKENGISLKYASKLLKSNKEIVKAAVHNNPESFQFASINLKKNSEFVLDLIGVFGDTKDNHIILEEVDSSLMKDKKFILSLIEQGAYLFAWEGGWKIARKDKDIILAVFEKDYRVLDGFDTQSLEDATIALILMEKKNISLKKFTENLKNNKSFVLSAVSQNGFNLEYASYDLQDDTEIVLAAVKNKGSAIDYASPRLQNDPNVVLVALETNRFAIKYLPDDFKRNEGLILKILATNLNVFKSLDDDLITPSFVKKIFENEALLLSGITEEGIEILEEVLRNSSDPEANKNIPSELLQVVSNLKSNKKIMLKAVRFDGMILQYINDELKKDKMIVIEAVKQNKDALQFADDILKSDPEVMIAIKNELNHKVASRINNSTSFSEVSEEIHKAPYSLKNLKEEYKRNWSIVLSAMIKTPSVLEYASDSLKKDRAFAYKVVSLNGQLLKYFDNSLKQDKLLVLKAVVTDSPAFQCANNIALKTEAFNGSSFQFADDSLKKDKDFVLKVVTSDGAAFQFADSSLKKDKEYVLKVVAQDEAALPYFDVSLQKDEEFILDAVKNNAKALGYANESLKKDKKFVLEAIKQNAGALGFADDSLKKDRRFVLDAVKENMRAFEYASIFLKRDEEIGLMAIQQNGLALKYVHYSLKGNKELVLSAVLNNGLALQYADDALKRDEEVVSAAIRQNKRALKFSLLEAHTSNKVLSTLLSLHSTFCSNKSTLSTIKKKLQNDSRFKLSKKFDSSYIAIIDKVSYAVTPDEDSCTTDLKLQDKNNKEVLFTFDDINKELINTGYKSKSSSRGHDEGIDGSNLLVREAIYSSPKGISLELSFPLERQDNYFMSLTEEYDINESFSAQEKSMESNEVPVLEEMTDRVYLVQLLATSSQNRSYKLANLMIQEGYSAFILLSSTGDKKLYRVRIGPYKTREKAIVFQDTLKESFLKNFFIQNSLVVSSTSGEFDEYFKPPIDKSKIEPVNKKPIIKELTNVNGLVIDKKTQLIWKRCAEGLSGKKCEKGGAVKLSHEDAKKRAEESQFANNTDWRIPTISELNTLVYCSTGERRPISINKLGLISKNDDKKELNGQCVGNYFDRPTVNHSNFPHNYSDGYWSSSKYSDSDEDLWTLFFQEGNIGFSSGKNLIRLVRSEGETNVKSIFQETKQKINVGLSDAPVSEEKVPPQKPVVVLDDEENIQVESSQISPISFKYNAAGLFYKGVAPVKDEDDLWGLISSNGNWVVLPEYADVGRYHDGFMAVKQNEKFAFLNTEGELITSFKYDGARHFSEDLSAVKLGNKWGYINSEDELKITAQFDRAREFKEGFAPVRVKKKWGYINKQGEWLLKPKFEAAYGFSEGKAVVVYKNKRGFINTNGEYVIKPSYRRVQRFTEGIAPASYKKNQWFFIDEENNKVIDSLFSDIRNFSEGLCSVRNIDKKWGYINKQGRLVIPYQFDKAYDFRNGLALVNTNDKRGFIDITGNVLVSLEYEDAFQFNEGLAPVKKNGMWGYIPEPLREKEKVQGNVVPIIPKAKLNKPKIKKPSPDTDSQIECALEGTC